MSKPSRPIKTAKVVVELPEKDEDANEQTLPFLARAAAPEDVKQSPLAPLSSFRNFHPARARC